MGDIGDPYGMPQDKGIGLIVTSFIRIAARRSVIKEFTYRISFISYLYYLSRRIRRPRKIALKAPNTSIIKNNVTSPRIKAYLTS